MEPLNRRYVDWLFEWVSRVVVAACAAGFLYVLVAYEGQGSFFLMGGAAFLVFHLLGFAPRRLRRAARAVFLAAWIAGAAYGTHPQAPLDGLFPVVGGLTIVWLLLSVIYGVLLIPRIDRWRDDLDAEREDGLHAIA